MARRRMKQTELYFPSWGGRRANAGRRPHPKGKRRVSHRARPEFAGRFPQHVTVRMLPSVWNMRSRRCFTVIRRAMWNASERFSFRVVHYAVMGNHIHLLVEADGKRSLTKGMQGLNIRIAKALNRVMRRHGQVLSDHYHAELLLSPTQTRRARQYLLGNARKHYGEAGPDRFASQAPLFEPGTWFLVIIERPPPIRRLAT